MEFFKKYFQDIADEYSGTYDVKEVIVKSVGFSSMPVSYHKIVVPVGDRKIFFDLEFGNHNMGCVKSEFNLIQETEQFKIRKKNIYRLLFSRNKQSLFVDASNVKTKDTIEQYFKETGLDEISRKTLFEPTILFEKDGSKTNVIINFGLSFTDKEEMRLDPLLSFINYYLNIIVKE